MRRLPQMEFCQDVPYERCEKVNRRKHHTEAKTCQISLHPLQFIHMDLFSRVNIMILSKTIYTLVIIDDFTKYTWVLLLY